MRRTLFYIPHECFELTSLNLGVVTVYIGWFLIVWIALAIGLIGYLIWRQGWNQDTKSYLPIIVIGALALSLVAPHLEIRERVEKHSEDKITITMGDPVGLPIRGYGMMVMLGAISGVGLAMYRGRRMGLHHDAISALAFLMVISGMVGARLFYIIQKWPEVRVLEENGQLNLAKTFSSIVSFQSGGLVVYGSVIGGVAAAVLYLRWKQLPMLAVGDLVAPAMLVGLCLGRLGCLLNGCCYGGVCLPENSFGWTALTFPREAAPYVDRQLRTSWRENSPPYQQQRAIGLMHGVRIAAPPDGPPLVAEVDNETIKDGTLAPRKGDRIQSFGNIKKASAMNLPLLFSDLDPEFKTPEGDTREWRIGELPERSFPVHPTQIYSSINAGLMALFLWFLYPFRRRDGQVFAVMLMIYPIARTLLERIRDDELGQFGTSLTISQWFSILVILLGVGLMWFIFKRPQKQGLTTVFAPT